MNTPQRKTDTTTNCNECRRVLGLPNSPSAISQIVHQAIPSNEKAVLHERFLALAAEYPVSLSEHPASIVSTCRDLIVACSPVLADTMKMFQNSSLRPDAIYLTGLPEFSSVEAGIAAGSLLSLGMASLAGEAFQYSSQNGGRLVGILSPKADFDGVKNTGESRQEFEAHSDDAVLAPDFSTDLIQLVGLVNESGAETEFILLDDLLARLSVEDVQILREPRFIFSAPASFKLKAPYCSTPRSIVFTGADGRDMIRLPTYNCKIADKDHRKARAALASVCALAANDALARSFVVGAGTALIFNNNRGLHSRKAFWGQRVVLRTYVRGSLVPLQVKTGTAGPVFDPQILLT